MSSITKFYSEAFLNYFPELLPIDQPPVLWRTLVVAPSGKRFKAPIYNAGWAMTYDEIKRKYKPKGTVLNATTPLYKRWMKLGYRKKYKHLRDVIRLPRFSQLNSRYFLFTFIQSGLKEDMDQFEEHKETIFKAMCELFDIDKTDVETIRGRFMWYRAIPGKYKITGPSLFSSLGEPDYNSSEEESPWEGNPFDSTDEEDNSGDTTSD